MHVINMHFFIAENCTRCRLHISKILQICKLSRSLIAVFIALWYNRSIDGVELSEVNIIGFIDIEFGFDLLKCDVVYRYLKFVE